MKKYKLINLAMKIILKIKKWNQNENENKIIDNNKLNEIKIITEESKEKPKMKIKKTLILIF
jgi:hypothetical protein